MIGIIIGITTYISYDKCNIVYFLRPVAFRLVSG